MYNLSTIALGVIVSIAGARGARGASSTCQATDLGTLGGRSSHAAAIDRNGVVVGSADTAQGETQAAVVRDGRFVALATLGGTASGRGTDDRGRVVGTASVGPEVSHAVLWGAGGARDLGALGEGRDAVATGINRRGEIVGYSQIERSNASPYHAFTVWRGRMRDLGAPGGADSIATGLNDRGMIVGFYGKPTGGSVAFLYWNGTFFDLGHLGGGDAEARAINERGQVVGVSQAGAGQRHAFRWYGGMRDLGTLGGTSSTALALNDAGDTVGTATVADGTAHAFLVSGDGPMLDLQQAAAPAGATLTEAVGIDDSGRIAANGRLADGADHAFLLTGCD